MCFLQCSFLYRKLPYLHALTGFLEMIFGVVRVGLFFSPLSTTTSSGTGSSSSSTSTTVSKKYSGKYVAAFIIDWISSIIPTMVGLFSLLVTIVILFKICIFCINAHDRAKNRTRNTEINTSGMLRKLIRQKALRRFLIIDCNCPCYKSRPRLRFQMRFLILFTLFILRITAIGLYATAPVGDNDGGALAIVCAISLIFLFNTVCLDLYRYCVWWHYTPEEDTRCHRRSKKHERYLPYHMVGAFRDPRTLGDRPCTDNPCHIRTLDHIAVFHSNDYQPQTRWRDIVQPSPDAVGNDKNFLCLKSKKKDNQIHYIGFHRTDPQAAISIAHSEFLPGKCGWIGAGVYFARSVDDTLGKAKSEGGAYIIAEIHMGKVYEVEREVITRNHPRFDTEKFEYAHHSGWHADYDTCYMLQNPENKDEFAIKDAASQIVKWVMVIDQTFDPKVEKYGLLTEFDSTKCGCI